MYPSSDYERVSSTLNSEEGEERPIIKEYGEKRLYYPNRRELFLYGGLALSNLIFLVLGIFVGSWATPNNTCSNSTTTRQSLSTQTTDAATSYELDGEEWVGTQCGNSTEEAKALGCIFDPLASNWYTPECFDGVVLAQWLAEPVMNHTWYYDKNHTEIMTFQQVNEGDWDVIYPLHNYHVAHCLYMWAKMHHSLINDMPIDENILDYGHTSHCIRRIMKAEEKKDNIVTETQNFPFCRRTRWGALDRD